MNLVKCYIPDSSWMHHTTNGGKPVGVLWHDTCGGNKRISRYIQPSDDDPNRDEILKVLGVNYNKNDWNHKPRADYAGVNAVIGLLGDDKTIATCITSDFDVHPNGCYRGPNGSCNGYYLVGDKVVYTDEFWIQFEICDSGYAKAGYDPKADKEYFDAVYKEACEFTAYICKMFNIDPLGYVDYLGQKVPTILCHHDAYKLGLGGNHYDVYGWFEQQNKTMCDVRNDVAALIGKKPVETFARGDKVNLKDGAVWANGKQIAGWLFNYEYLYIYSSDGTKSKITCDPTLQAVSGTIYNKYLAHFKEEELIEEVTPDIEPEPEPDSLEEIVTPEPEPKPIEDETPDIEPEPNPEPQPINDDNNKEKEEIHDDDITPEPEPVNPDDEDVKNDTLAAKIIKTIVAIMKLIASIFKKK